jgi:putative ABC transport system permease protein
MSLWKIAWRSIQQRSLASALTALSMALGVSLVVAVLVVHGVIDLSFRRGGEGYDLIIGAKGGRQQLVLNTVFYMDKPTGAIPYSYYEEFVDGRFAPWTETVVPVCMGHDYEGIPVVGTTPDMFESLTYRDAQEYKFARGENFKAEEPFEAVVGATAAKETGLDVGKTFKAVHGGKAHEQEFNVVGVLEHTGTPNDRALFVNMDGFYKLHDAQHAEHADQHADADTNAHDQDDCPSCKKVTAILLCVKPLPPGRSRIIAQEINGGKDAQAVFPGKVIAELLSGMVGNVQLILLIFAVTVVVVAGIGIMVSIYNSMNDRRHEIAVMRALGAGRSTVMVVILLESILLSLGGGLLGLLLGHGALGILAPLIVEQTGVTVGMFQFRPDELILIPGLVILATLVGYLPAVAAYRTDVAKSLTNTP